MSKEYFECRYEVYDGYVGKASPLFFKIAKSDIEDGMDVEKLAEIFEEEMDSHFNQNVEPSEINKEKFIAWAKSISA